MKAVQIQQYGGPEVLVVRDADTPEPGADEVRVRLHAAGVNPVDTYLRSAAQGYAPKLPWIPGMDGAGIVDAVGDQVNGLKPGQRVYVHGGGLGTYAEYCVCRPSRAYPLPDNLDFAEGASLGVPYFTAARALFTRGDVQSGDKVLIHGASGGVGSACLQLLASQDVKVWGTAGSDAGLELVAAGGAEAVNHRSPASAEVLRESGGFDLIIEMLANANLAADLTLLAAGGRVVVVGSRGPVEIMPRDMMGPETAVMGTTLMAAGPGERAGYADIVAREAAAGHIRPPVAQVFDLPDAPRAHEAVITGPHSGNIVIRI